MNAASPDNSDVRRVAILGAGECGARAALRLRQLGFSGELTLIGNEPAAPYERPNLSKGVLTRADTPPSITSKDALATENIGWHTDSTVERIDREQSALIFTDGKSLSYDRLLIATGSRARRPAVDESDAVSTLRSLGDAEALRERLSPGTNVIVIGGGFIGLEVAASAITMGCRVTVVEFAHRLMSRVVPAKVASVLENRHLEAGVDLRLGVSVEEFARRGDGLRVVLSDGSNLTFDVAVAGVGALPNVELAASAGLSISNGIAVDHQLRTDDPKIFAGGDCCSFPHSM